ncbi:hypothetical protein NDU88_007837 [Pleurodeles waltl]|uniref:Uncharacterized protein n=1 Tax=Pleurodeles waltl TaxID=8319 RepID=A0AAV7PRE1_PLEWA|nr:hypothetical protein NDU88_007837 [Pleurodeles waltl]
MRTTWRWRSAQGTTSPSCDTSGDYRRLSTLAHAPPPFPGPEETAPDVINPAPCSSRPSPSGSSNYLQSQCSISLYPARHVQWGRERRLPSERLIQKPVRAVMVTLVTAMYTSVGKRIKDATRKSPGEPKKRGTGPARVLGARQKLISVMHR